MNYLDVVAGLPLPTPEQTSRFADHVAENHSWYKHLPFFPPGASFVFFPNPHAGRRVAADGSTFAVCDSERGDYFSHHSRLSTADYRDRFGYWDYWVDENPRVADPLEGPWIYGLEGGRRELLPDSLKRRWGCRLTAFLKPAPTMFALCADDLAREHAAFAAYARQHADGADVARYQAVAEALRHTDEPTWGSHAVLAFMDDESQFQKVLLLAALLRVRGAWDEAQG